MKQLKSCIALSLFFLFVNARAQSGDTLTLYYDYNWQPSDGVDAPYYRKAVWDKAGKRLHVFDYYMATHKLQMTGNFLDKGATLKTDSFVYFYPDGSIEMTGKYLVNKRDGRWVYYFPDKTLDGEGNYVDHKKVGTWNFCHSNGQKSSEEEYVDDELVKIQAWTADGTTTKDACIFKLPSFPGGSDEMSAFYRNNLMYPEFARENAFEGVVLVSFKIDPSGKPFDFAVLNNPHKTLSREALRVMKLMPGWTPGCSHNRKATFPFKMPVTFRLN
jgi:TonB family protein